MITNNLKISIITVCLNSEDTIEKSIQSVVSQTYSNIEYIIVDGKSTDNTLPIIDKYMSYVDILISEPDNGIYHAMNKGVKLATGDIIYFLNSGDYFYNLETVKKISNMFLENRNIDLIYGNCIYYDEDSAELISSKCKDNIEIVAQGINHQSIFAKRKVFEKCGFFDASYKVYGDYDWLIRALVKHKQKIIHVDLPVVYYLKGGFSGVNCRRFQFERFDISLKYLSSIMFLKYFLLYPKIVSKDLKIKALKTLKLRDFK